MDYLELSKEVSYALRHAPWKYELELDDEGWVDMNLLLDALRANSRWNKIEQNDIINMISNSQKKRHEIRGGKIRAYYGHSLPNKIKKQRKHPPETLYHGTTHKAVSRILSNGLVPQKRQYVHLSQDKETAYNVGRRRDKCPIVLEINAGKADNDGIKFYLGNEKVWLADFIPPQYIKNS